MLYLRFNEVHKLKKGVIERYKFSPVWSHYTQLVWAKTTRLGCAVNICPQSSFPVLVVCNYDPPGNMGGAPVYQKDGDKYSFFESFVVHWRFGVIY